jgi:hypothetical protein
MDKTDESKKPLLATAERPAAVADLLDPPAPANMARIPQAGPMQRPAPVAQRALMMQDALQGLVPTSIGEAVELSKILAKSQVVPKALRGQPDSVFTVVIAGLELGLTPIRALQNLQAIHGNLGMKADLQLALAYSKGSIEYFDEGYEERETTDTDLAVRTKDHAKILALVKNLPRGKPYGWCSCQRQGRQLVTRVFSFADAERAFTYEGDDEGGGSKTKKKLSEKFNYQSWPMDMYPRRARVRVLAITHSDILAGLPSVEALQDKAIVEGELMDDDPALDTDQLLAELDEADHDAAVAIAAGFDQLKIAGAKKLTTLLKYRGNPKDLLTWLKDEYALRKTGSPKKREDVLGDSPATPTPTTAPPAQEAQAAVQEAAQVKEPEPPTQEPKAADPVPEPEPKKPSAKDLAARFKQKLDTF